MRGVLGRLSHGERAKAARHAPRGDVDIGLKPALAVLAIRRRADSCGQCGTCWQPIGRTAACSVCGRVIAIFRGDARGLLASAARDSSNAAYWQPKSIDTKPGGTHVARAASTALAAASIGDGSRSSLLNGGGDENTPPRGRRSDHADCSFGPASTRGERRRMDVLGTTESSSGGSAARPGCRLHGFGLGRARSTAASDSVAVASSSVCRKSAASAIRYRDKFGARRPRGASVTTSSAIS